MDAHHCPNGHDVDPGHAFCPHCGVRVSEQPAVTGPEDHTALTVDDGAERSADEGATEVPEPELAEVRVGAPTSPAGGSVWAQWSDNTKLAVVGAALLVLVLLATGVAAAAGQGGSSEGGGVVVSLPKPAPKPLTREERCVRLVMNLLWQVPDALNEGYQGGVKTDTIMYQYGSTSNEYMTAVTTQAQLIGNIMTNGNPYGQVAKMRPDVQAGCQGY